MYYSWTVLGTAYGVTDGLLNGTRSSFTETTPASNREDALFFVTRTLRKQFPGWDLRIQRIVCKALDIDEEVASMGLS